METKQKAINECYCHEFNIIYPELGQLLLFYDNTTMEKEKKRVKRAISTGDFGVEQAIFQKFYTGVFHGVIRNMDSIN